MQVGKRRRRHDEYGHPEAIGCNHPLHAVFTDRKVVLNRRQRHIHDQRVQKDHEQAKPGCDKGDALRAVHRRDPPIVPRDPQYRNRWRSNGRA